MGENDYNRDSSSKWRNAFPGQAQRYLWYERVKDTKKYLRYEDGAQIVIEFVFM